MVIAQRKQFFVYVHRTIVVQRKDILHLSPNTSRYLMLQNKNIRLSRSNICPRAQEDSVPLAQGDHLLLMAVTKHVMVVRKQTFAAHKIHCCDCATANTFCLHMPTHWSHDGLTSPFQRTSQTPSKARDAPPTVSLLQWTCILQVAASATKPHKKSELVFRRASPPIGGLF